MNERIQQLAVEAGKYARDYVADCKHYGHYMEHNELEVKFEEKFAELIVRECVGVADDYVKDCTCDEHKNCKHPRSIIGRKIKEHFGVEE
jgi:hypothetical protein